MAHDGQVAPLKTKGDMAELIVAADLVKRGFRVAFPFGEDCDFLQEVRLVHLQLGPADQFVHAVREPLVIFVHYARGALVEVVNHLTGDPADGSEMPFGYICTKDELGDCRIRFQYKWGQKRFGTRATKRRDLQLEDLSRDRLYEFALIAAPIRLRGATGSPLRPLAFPLRS